MTNDAVPVPSALREEDAFLALADTLSALIALIQGDKLVYVNPAGCRLLGHPRERFIGRNFWEFAVPEEQARIRERGRNRQQGVELPRRFTERLRHADGHDVWFDYSVDVIRLDGKVTTLVTGHDISERMRSEEALRQSDERFRAAFDNAAIGKAITHASLKILRVNRAFRDMLGYTEAELLLKSPMDITHPDDLEEGRAFIERLLSGAASSGRLTKRYLRKDGRIAWADLTTTLMRDAEGRPSYFVSEIVDISERKDREDRLAEAQRIAHVGSWEWDVAGDRVTWSDELYRIYGLDPARFPASYAGFLARLHPSDRERAAAVVEAALRDGKPFEYEHRVVRDDGEVRTLWARGRVDRDVAGRPLRLYGVAQDVTERVRAAEALRLSDERFRAAFENAAIGKVISSPSLKFLQVNKAFCDMLGYTEAEILARSPAELTPPEDRAAGLAFVARLVSGEAASSRWVKRYLHKDGRIVWGDLTTTLIRDAEGRPSYFAGEVVDITERKRTEELLRDREAKLAEAQRIAHVGSWEWNVPADRVAWSDECYRIFGLEPGSCVPTIDSIMSRVPEEDRPRLQKTLEDMLARGGPFEMEHPVLRGDGERRTVWATGRVEHDAAGRPLRVIGISQDVTERKRAEEALRASEQRFRSLFTQAPVMMVAFHGDGRIREVSSYWLKTLGYTRDEVIGQDGFRFLTPASAARLREEVERNTLAGELVHRNIPLQAVRKDGTVLDILVTSVFEVDEQGRPLGAIAVSVDVTDIKRAEEAVRESEARYRALVEHAPEAIVVLDVETGRFIDLNGNAEAMFGYPREKLLTMGPLDFCPPKQACGSDSKDVAWCQMGRVMKGESPVFEFVHTHASGREVPCQIRLSRLPATGRELVRATLTDISELKALQEKVRHAEKMAAIGVLAAGVAHEVGNPLLALSMAAQSLERKTTDDYALKKLGLIREHIERISKIVRQMSDLARPPSFQRTSVDVNRVLERSLEVVRYDKRAKEVSILFEPCPKIPFVLAVEDQLVQVCLNLALNALDAVAANPPERPKTLTIAARCVERDGRRWVRAGFADSGPGIPESARSKIFQPFFTTKEPGQGTGLGLSVSYRLIEEHRGALSFVSGDGSEFYFELPVQEGESESKRIRGSRSV